MAEKKQIISVTGSTGHLGSVLIPMLLEQGFGVKALYRKARLPLESPDLQWIRGDLREDSDLIGLADGADAVIHCGGIISVGEGNHDEMVATNVNGTEVLARICASNRIRLIHISSATATQAAGHNSMLDEGAPLVESKDFFYGWTKARAEERLQSAILEDDLDVVILRPTALVGPPDSQPSRFGRTLLDLYAGRLPMITSGGYDLLDIRDFSQTAINSITMGRKGSVYLTGGEYYSLKELAKMVNPKNRPPVVPIDLLIGLLPLIRVYHRLFPMRWPINKESLYTLKKAPKRVDSSRAKAELMHRYRPLEESINDLIEWSIKTKET